MSAVYLYAVASTILVSSIALIGITTIYIRPALIKKLSFLAVGLASGAMFGNALIHLLPGATEIIGSNYAALAALSGIVLFFVLEKLLHWHHHDHFDPDEHVHVEREVKPLGYLVLTSDTAHNFIDGLVIGAAYLVSVEVGIAATIAVILHEIPQELSDYGVLLHAGFSKKKALLTNFGTGLTAVLGAILVVTIGNVSELLVAIISAFAAGMFLYIAGSDLIPELHKVPSRKNSLWQLVMMLLGIALMFGILLIE